MPGLRCCQTHLSENTGRSHQWEWEQTTAFRERVYPIPCHTICRPGPRLIDGMEKLHSIFFAASPQS